MADQVASLVVEVDASGAKKAAVDLDTLAKAADRADNAANDLADSSRKLSAAEQTVANEAKRAMEGVSHLAAEQEAAVKTAQRLNAAHGSAVISSKALNQATLNLGRQFADIGTSLSSGMSPLMVAVQQGPQIVDIFAQLKTQGVGAGAAFQAMGAALAPALPLILGIGAAVGVVVGAFALFERAVDKETKHATSFGDTWKATLKVTGDYIMDGPIGDGLKWLGKAFNTTLDVITGVVAGGAVKIAGFFGASYLAIVNNWKRLPEVVGVILQNAANAAIKATEWLINKGIDGINALGKNFGFAQIGKVALGTFKSASLDIAKQFDADQKRIEAETSKGMKDLLGKIAAEADKNYERRQKAAKGAAKATEEHTKAVLANNDAYRASEDALTGYLAKLNEEIATMGMSAEAVRRREAEQMAALASTPQLAEFVRALAKMYEDQARVGKEAAEVQKAIGAAANDNIRTFEALGAVMPNAMERAATEMERVSALSKDVAWGVEDIADAINSNDWTSAFVNLARVLSQVQNAFKTGADSATKFAAAAGLAQGVGAVVGGSTGSAIGGAASGALAGFQLGGPVGAVIGGGIGLVTSLFGSSKAKKQQRAQEAAQRAAEEAQRQQQISDTTFSLNVAILEAQGKAEEALAMTRQRELDALAKLDPALVALQQQLYAAEDAASAAAKEAEAQAQALQKEIAVRQTQRGIMLQLMALDDAVTGGNSAVVAARQDELAALDPVSRQLKEIYYARLDEGDALAKQTEATERAAAKAKEVADAQASIQDRINQATLTSAELMYLGREKELKAADALDASLGPMLIKLWGFEDAATKAAEATARAADEFERLQSNQTTNIGLMRQLMAMDDAVLGTTSARDAMRADELSKLDATGQYLQKIIWAREDEQKIIDANVAKMEAAAARAKELASRQGSIQDQIDQLTLSSSDLLLKTRSRERAEAVAFDASLGPLLDSLYSLQDAARATALANEAAAEAQRVAAEEAQRAAETYASRMTKLANLLQVSGRTSEAVLLQRSQELASIVDPVSRALQLQTYAAQDLADQIANARTALTSAYERESGAIEAFRDKLVGVGDSLRSYSATLGSTLSGSASASSQRAQAEAAFRDIVTRYQQGDVSLAGQIPALGEAFAKASQAASKDQLSYLRDIAYIKAETDMAAAKVDTQVSVAEAQLEQLKAQVNGLINVETATVSVAQAVTDLTDLIRKTTYGQDERAQAIQDQINGMQGPMGLIWSVLGYKAALAAGLPQYNGANDNLPGFATGGSFMVGGVGGPDSQTVPLRLTPGEMVNVSREDNMRAMADAIAALTRENAAMRQELSGLRSDMSRTARASEKTANTLTRVTRDGDSLITEAA